MLEDDGVGVAPFWVELDRCLARCLVEDGGVAYGPTTHQVLVTSDIFCGSLNLGYEELLRALNFSFEDVRYLEE